jgi:hypothetical protein
MPVRDPQPMDAGFEHRMLVAVVRGKFVAFAAVGRWTTSVRFASRDADLVRARSLSAVRAFMASATATSPADFLPASSRSEQRERAIKRRQRVSPIIVSAIASCDCANAQR